ncbi:hypothetical protein CGI80_25645, partial [Vibrio parahaemolyticus]|uniref:hypothetical protein n=1 Tax=Vibrio parahaemolyticus TaxID=670 RepID=UPI00116B81A6
MDDINKQKKIPKLINLLVSQLKVKFISLKITIGIIKKIKCRTVLIESLSADSKKSSQNKQKIN